MEWKSYVFRGALRRTSMIENLRDPRREPRPVFRGGLRRGRRRERAEGRVGEALSHKLGRVVVELEVERVVAPQEL